jgi:flagellar export protein FliJ
MAGFRFRAQPALDLRRREYEAAQRVLARADAERQQAQARVEAAGRASAQARREADEAVRTPIASRDREWYRFWIVRLDREREAAAATLAQHDDAVAAARAACLHARQRCEALERFRDKAQSAYLAGLAAEERKIIDDLATQRYALRPDRGKGA